MNQNDELWYIDTPFEIKQQQILLEILKTMLMQELCPIQSINDIIELEKELTALPNKSDNLDRVFRAATNSNFRTKSFTNGKYTGSELLHWNLNFKRKPRRSIIESILKSNLFDINKIDETIALFKALSKLDIAYLYIDKNFYDCYAKEGAYGIGQATLVRDDYPKFLDFSNYHYQIGKIFSDKEVKYELKENPDELEEVYNPSFADTPNWFISGMVIYDKQRRIYKGNSSPHTHFDFFANSFSINPHELPTRKELYSAKTCKSLVKTLQIEDAKV